MGARAEAPRQAETDPFTRPINFSITDGALNALKWLAVASMIVDHTNAYLFENASATAQAFGRLAFPLFAFVLGYNLARTPPQRFEALAKRLALFGLISQPFYGLMVNDPWRFNIFFTFLVAIGLVALLKRAPDKRSIAAAIALFVVSGFFVDFHWYGTALAVAAYFFASRKDVAGLLGLLAALTMLTLYLFLQIGWPALVTLVTLPLAYGVRDLRSSLPRLRWAFYAIYPAHIAILVFGVHVLAWR